MTDVYTMMAEGKPYKSYIKTIHGKVRVYELDIANEKSLKERILKGNPKKKDENCIIDVWSEKQNQVFKRANAPHFAAGHLIEYTRPDAYYEEVKERSIAEWTDEELLNGVLKAKFQSFQKTLNECELVPVLYRMYNISQEQNLSTKLVERIIARISEVQGTPFDPEEA